MSKSTIDTLKKLSRENHDPRFPPEAYRVLPKIRTDTEQKLRFCNAEIMRFESLLERFYIEREALEKQLDLVLSLQAPIRSLPVSLLQDILVETVSTGMKASKLSKVCSHWRSVVIDCPTFWSTLDMDKRMWRHPDADNILNHFLTRSREHPLSAVVGRRVYNLGNSGENLPPLWGLLASLSERWASLNLSLREITPLDELVGLQFSALQDLSLSVSSPPSQDIDWSTGFPVPTGVPSRKLFPDAPLTSVSLARFRPFMIELPWERLTMLELLSVTLLSSDLQILSRCRRLQVLKLRESRLPLEVGEPLPEWTLPITTLQLDSQSSNCSLPVCPYLTTFNLHNRGSAWTQMRSYELTHILGRYGDQIQTLSIDVPNPSAKSSSPSLISVLDAGPCHSVPDETPPQLSLLCPNLKELSVFLHPKHADAIIAGLISVIHTRRDTGFERLKLRLNLYTPRTWESPDPGTVPLPYDIASLRSLVGQGIQVMVMHMRPRKPRDDHGEVDVCELWHVLDQEEDDVEEENEDEDENGRHCGIQCHFVRTPHFETGDFGGRRWRSIEFRRFQSPKR